MKNRKGSITACLLGGALGDALGYEVEFSSWPAIQARFGKNGIRQLSLEDGKARFSDDTQMTLFTAEGLCLAADRGEEAVTGIHQAYLCWLQTQGYPSNTPYAPLSALLPLPELNRLRAPGNTCLSALCSGSMGTLERPINHSKGCGGVMRTAPCGLVRREGRRGEPFGDPLLLGAGAAAVTHGHPLGWIPAGMLADLTDRCVYGSYSSLRQLAEDSLAATVRAFADHEEIVPFEALIRRAMALAERPVEKARETAEVDEPAIRSLGQGWVGEEALAIALYAALRYDGDLKAVLIAAVNHGGDSDSTGAICGNILGAWLGMDAIPADWAGQLELRQEIEDLAARLERLTE